MNKLVTIIVPVYNVDLYLPGCLDSIVKQTYKEIEIILVDDGSTDQSQTICKEYANRDSRIKYISKDHNGLSDTRNVGIENATGEYITFVDSDDCINLNLIEYMMKIMIEERVDIVCTRYIRYKEGTAKLLTEMPTNRNKIRTFLGSEIFKEFLSNGNISTTVWGKLYKTALFSEIRFPLGKIHEDIFTTYQILAKSNTVVTSDFIGYGYRYNEKGIMRKAFSKKRLDSIEAKILQAEFVKERYPEYKKNANAGIIYSCNVCLKSMSGSQYYDDEIINQIQLLYKKYTGDYLKSNFPLKGKIFAVISYWNVRLSYRILRLL